MPRSTELLRDIHETNLMYLLLLQRIARSGNAAAIAGMQLSVEACAWLTRQNHEDLARLAAAACCWPSSTWLPPCCCRC